MSKILKFTCLACLLSLAMPGVLRADQQDDDSHEGARSCINTVRIRNSKVVDDRNILFYMNGKTIYHVILPHRCYGLRREGRFSYRTTSGNLCHLDSIRVLYSSGMGLDEGASCQLGYFNEVDEEYAEGLIEGIQKQPLEAKPLPPAEPEDVTKEPEES